MKKRDYNRPLYSRVKGKTASDFRIQPTDNDLTIISDNGTTQTLIARIKKLEEDNQYLSEVIEDLRDQIINTDNLR